MKYLKHLIGVINYPLDDMIKNLQNEGNDCIKSFFNSVGAFVKIISSMFLFAFLSLAVQGAETELEGFEVYRACRESDLPHEKIDIIKQLLLKDGFKPVDVKKEVYQGFSSLIIRFSTREEADKIIERGLLYLSLYYPFIYKFGHNPAATSFFITGLDSTTMRTLDIFVILDVRYGFNSKIV